jgi:hypothetical protein
MELKYIHRRDRREKDWKIGMMEYWNIGKPIALPTLPSFHCSIIPFFACLNSAVSASSAVKDFLWN